MGLSEIKRVGGLWRNNMDEKMKCPAGHKLGAYVSQVDSSKIILTCNEEECKWYDFNNFYLKNLKNDVPEYVDDKIDETVQMLKMFRGQIMNGIPTQAILDKLNEIIEELKEVA